ncbi:Ig-like domain-containing protein [Spirochaeta isovalerica]|uniref:Uncharacterized protein n=1 Tax=Spirochaeta isovalerica TaxID=150 RepID=A0A841R7F5_9SPIO|nr:Ig-like domain-containing protein [Spirochaeta isovalerica]MBB6478909.1 hypothetical protein [Spirochaeta isovalerica]
MYKVKIKKLICLWLIAVSGLTYAQSDDKTLATEESVKDSVEYHKVNGLENWTYDYDISGFKDGTYNLIIRSRDRAGNISIDGPINIFIDSESDLPVATISSPSRSMRVGGNFNIVGTAKDDDAVAFVEYRINDGTWMKADGTIFWAAFVNTDKWNDGKYTLYARASDVNGLTGPEYAVEINLDKTKPVITVDSHENGEILSGKKKISGSVVDTNGVLSLEFSLDGETWENLKLSGKEEHAERAFSLDLDTRENAGGTSYVRFRALDNTGSEGSTVFVYYSDNEKPVITLISPTEEDILNGRITVTGTVTDEVGIKSFICVQDGGEEEEIILIPGNPYWNKTFDYSGLKGGTISFLATDLSDNTEEIKYKFKTALEEDLPVVSLIDFTDGDYLNYDEPVLKGIVNDDDGPASVSFSIDGGEVINQDTYGPFVLDFYNLEPGKHILEISGTDIYGINGVSSKYVFYKATSEPVLILTEYTRDKEILPWFNGAVFQQGKTAKISGRVEGGENDITLFYSFDGQEELTSKVTKGLFSIALPGKPEPGAYDLSMRVEDSLERKSEINCRIYIAPAPGKDESFNPLQLNDQGLIISDIRLRSQDPVNISQIMPLTGFIAGDSVRSVELDPPQNSIKAEVLESGFSLVPLSETAPVRFKIKVFGTSGKEYVSEEIYAASDFSPPVLTLNPIRVPVKIKKNRTVETLQKNSEGEEVLVESVEKITEIDEISSNFIQNLMILKGEFDDMSPLRKVSLEYSGTTGTSGNPLSIDFNREGEQYLIDQEFDLSSINEGSHFFTLVLEDDMGNISRTTMPFIIDRTIPEVRILSPGPEEPVEGIITVSGVIEGFHGQGKLYFSEDGATFNPVELTSHNTFSHNIDLSVENSDSSLFVFKAVDGGRNEVEYKPVFNVDLDADKPSAVIEVPSTGSTLRNDFSITGLVFDDDAVDSIYYSVDGGEFRSIEGNFYYNIPFSLDDLDDGEHKISIYAEDIGGFPSDIVESKFLISKSEPVSTVINPSIDDYIKSTIVVEGQSFDENGIRNVFISYDNGITFNEATILQNNNPEGISAEDPEPVVNIDGEDTPKNETIEKETVKTVFWEYSFDTRLPGDGTHSILIKAIDGAGTVGISSTIINIDNTVPEIKLDTPGESSSFAGQLILDGKVYDGTGLKSVIAELNALDDPEFETFTNEIVTEGVFREVYDISGYKPGLYNLNITVVDFADNSISETRNLKIIPDSESRSVDIFFPEEGKSFAGPFAIDGIVKGSESKRIVLKIDGEIFETLEADENGLFSFPIDVNSLSDGKHVAQVEIGTGESSIISRERTFEYMTDGPWVQVGNIISGQFVSGRPMVTGNAGYSGLNGEDSDKTKTVDYVEVSLDNGQTFSRAKGRENWEFRLETYDLPEGINQLIISAHFRDGTVAVSKLFVNIDETAPDVDLFYPEENRTFNENISLVGTASDANGLDTVEVLIREGRKEKYEVPSFIQGLYIDFHALGSTYGEIGVGLSFFDDVVKLQVQAGLAPPGRFTGIVIGAKLLATILDIPFSYFFGYDWDFFSMSLAVGANFNYFTMSEDGYSFTENGVVLGSVLVQYEFAKFEIENWSLFNSYSLYAEAALWFISSDIEAGVTPTISFGARIGIF